MAQTSKKLYKAIAAKMATQRLDVMNSGEFTHNQLSYLELISDIIGDLAAIFAADNPNFDREKFYAACYKEDK